LGFDEKAMMLQLDPLSSLLNRTVEELQTLFDASNASDIMEVVIYLLSIDLPITLKDLAAAWRLCFI